MVAKYIFLGLIQGITEFLPVSSSGHLVIISKILGINTNLEGIVFLHLATALALIVYFYKDIVKTIKQKQVILNLGLAFSITVVLALFFNHYIKYYYTFKPLILGGFIVTAVILFLANRFSGSKQIEDIKPKDSLWTGICQSIAIIPGISRSGATIFALLSRKISPISAFKFSFLLAIPTILAAFIYESRKIAEIKPSIGLFCGFIASFVFGLLSLTILKKALLLKKLNYFGFYCIFIFFVGLFVL